MKNPYYRVAREIALPLLLQTDLGGFVRYVAMTMRRPSIDARDIVRSDYHARCQEIADRIVPIINNYLAEVA